MAQEVLFFLFIREYYEALICKRMNALERGDGAEFQIRKPQENMNMKTYLYT